MQQEREGYKKHAGSPSTMQGWEKRFLLLNRGETTDNGGKKE